MSQKLCGIYCIENTTNNKKYIGLSRDIKRRWSEHKTALRKSIHNNQYLQLAWNKYGEGNFIFYIIELCEESLLSERECFYIKEYKTLSHESGYNLTSGGENTSIGKQVISLKNSLTFQSVQEAAKYNNVTSVTMISWCRQKRNYMYRDEYDTLSSEEQEYWKTFDWDTFIHEKLSKAHSRENRSESNLKKISKNTSGENNPRAIKVYCPQLNEVFECIKYASKKYGVNKGSITSCLKGRLKSAGKHPITGEKLTWEKFEK